MYKLAYHYQMQIITICIVIHITSMNDSRTWICKVINISCCFFSRRQVLLYANYKQLNVNSYFGLKSSSIAAERQCEVESRLCTKYLTSFLQVGSIKIEKYELHNKQGKLYHHHHQFDHGLIRILDDDLHWLDVADRVTYKLGVIMHRCWHGKAPRYLVDCCTPVTDVVGRQRLRSATQQLMVVPWHRLSTVGRRAFAVHGPMVWNSLPDDLRAQQDYVLFKQGLKTWLFARY